MKTTHEHAEAIAARLDPVVGFDPITILTIIGTLISIFVNCWRIQHPTADYAVRALKDEYTRHPKRLLRRMKRMAKREGGPMTDEQAEAIAQATIDEALKVENVDELVLTMRGTPVVAVAPEEPDDEDD